MPDFKGGKLRDYAMWKRDWKDLISGRYDPNHELRMIRERVPEKVRGLVEHLTSMDEVWTLLDEEFGKHSELVSDRWIICTRSSTAKGLTVNRGNSWNYMTDGQKFSSTWRASGNKRS